jgi:hypothetical protein
MTRYAIDERPIWLYAAGVGLGLTFLTKETGILFAAAIYVFLAISPTIRVKIKHLILSALGTALIIMLYPLTLVLAGGGGSQTTSQYLAWQLIRRPNHEWDFYITSVLPALGWFLILVAVCGLLAFYRSRSWREGLLLSWIIIPALFFQIWPTKGFQYLLPIAPPVAILAGQAVSQLAKSVPSRIRAAAKIRNALLFVTAGLVTLSLLVPCLRYITPTTPDRFLAGSGGVPGGREAGEWVLENVPEGATLMTIGPSMANILQFYGHRKASGLSVSPNPLHRNPSYQPILNPDYQMRIGEIQYLVWDVFSAERSEFFSNKLLEYVKKYNGRTAHVEIIEDSSSGGPPISQPVIIIYEVRP